MLFLAKTSKPAAAKRSQLIGKVDKAIDRLVLDPRADVEQLAEQLVKSCDLSRRDAERLLLRRLLKSNDEHKRAVVQLLAICGSSDSVPHLLRLSRRRTFRKNTLTIIERIVGVERLGHLACQTNSPGVRAAIYKRLLNAGSEPALRGYLSLVRSENLGAEALAATDAVSGELLDMLLTLLKDEDGDVRLSAAMVLGHANGPEVSAALIAFVTEEPPRPTKAWNPTEAWIAILACRGRQTEEFIDYVMRQPKLLGQFNRARVRLAQMTL